MAGAHRLRGPDRRFAFLASAVGLGMLAAPLVVGAVAGPSGHAFTWTVVDPGDTFVFLGQMAHASRGHWDFVDLFTNQRVPTIPVYLFYTAIGHLVPVGWVSPAGLGLAYQGSRLILATVAFWQGWLLMRELCPSLVARRVAFILAFFTAGLGVYELAVPALRAADHAIFDLAADESNTFAGLLSFPHHAAVLVLFILYLRALLRLATNAAGSWRACAVAAACAAALSLIHPDKAVVTAAATLIALGWTAWARGLPRVAWVQGFLTAAAGAPYALQLAAVLKGSALLTQIAHAGTSGSGQLLNPNLFYYLLGFGIPGALALSDIPVTWARLRRASAAAVVAWSMVLASVIVALLPSDAVEHRLEGVQLVLAALAGTQLVHHVLPRLWRTRWFGLVASRQPLGYSRRRLRLLSINLVLIASAPSVLLIVVSTSGATVVGARDLYLRPGEPAALAWLRARTSSDDVAVATPPSARFIAAYGGARVAFGNAVFTPGYSAEERQLAAFFSEPGYDRENYLRTRAVSYLYFGPLEEETAAFDPATSPYLTLVYVRDGVRIFRVTRVTLVPRGP